MLGRFRNNYFHYDWQAAKFTGKSNVCDTRKDGDRGEPASTTVFQQVQKSHFMHVNDMLIWWCITNYVNKWSK
jgi:hypothetical protein